MGPTGLVYMAVRTETVGDTTRIIPKLDPEWDQLKKLSWKAGAAQLTTGLSVRVGAATVTVNGKPQGGLFDVKIGRTLHGACSYQSAWNLMSGAESGHNEATRKDQT